MSDDLRKTLFLIALCTGLAAIGCAGEGGADTPQGPALYFTSADGLHGCDSDVIHEAVCGERIRLCGVGLTPGEVLVIERVVNGERSEVVPIQTTTEDNRYSDPGVFSHVADDFLPADCSAGQTYEVLVDDPRAGEVTATITTG